MKNFSIHLSYLFIIFLLLGAIGCNKKKNNSGKINNSVAVELDNSDCSSVEEVIESITPVTIQLSGSRNYEHTLKFTDMVDKVEYIPLETTEDCLLGDFVELISITENFIFMTSYGILFQFDRQGKFIRQINKHGQGPGECYAISVGLDEKRRLIYILGIRTLSVSVFDFDGKYLKTMKNPIEDESGIHSPSFMGCDSKGNILYTFQNYGSMKYKYVAVNSEFEILYKCPNYVKYDLKERIFQFGLINYSIYEYNDRSYYSYVYNDTVFRINDDYSCSPAWINRIPNKYTLEDDLKTGARVINYSDLNGKNCVGAIREYKKYIYIYHHLQQSIDKFISFLSLYNKQTGQLTENINPLIENDWDGGVDIELNEFMQHENIKYELLQPFDMKEKLTSTHFSKTNAKYPEAQKALQTIVNTILEDDNPVIMIITLK